MNKLYVLLFCITLHISLNGKGQTSESLAAIDEMPEFPGGMKKLSSWLSKNLSYPVFANDNCIEGIVKVKFTVDVKGNTTDIHILQSVHSSLDNEAIRIIQSMPKWKPGIYQGQPVAVYYTMPINFSMPESKDSTPALNIKLQYYTGKRSSLYDKFPEYIGNLDSMLSINIPEEVKTVHDKKTDRAYEGKYIKAEVHTKVHITFTKTNKSQHTRLLVTITKDGYLGNIRQFKGVKPSEFSEAAINFLTSFNQVEIPKWRPAVKNDIPVDCDLILKVVSK